MKRSKKPVILIIILILIGLGVWYGRGLYEKHHSGPLVIYGNVDIRTVNVSPRVGGRLASLAVDEGDAVTAGQVLGEIDSGPYQNALDSAKADVAAQEAQLALLREGYRSEEIAQVRSELRERQVALEYAESFYKRVRTLAVTNAVSKNDLDVARDARERAAAALQASRDKLAQYESGMRQQDIDAQAARLMQAQAARAQAELNLADTVLKSPSDGVILTRAVEPGTMLQAGGAVFTISLTRPVWVRAYVGETNLAKAVPGARLHIFTDARPSTPYSGTIGFVSPTAEFTPKTVQTPELRTDLVYRLRIIVSYPDDALRQGMPVTVRFLEGS